MKQDLEYIERQRKQNNAGVEHRVLQHLPLRAEAGGDGADKDDPKHGKQHAQNGGHVDKQRKVTVALFPVTLAKGLGDDRRTAGAEH